MRIGETAALVGLTTRAIRHHHHVGLLPEPERRPNGYRAYSVREELFAAISEDGVVVTGVKEALPAEYTLAQAETVYRLMDAFMDRGRG
ncbi:MerR family DNA-binding transcriptional regulator [Streptomyces sp. NPDC020742]|uniref:MerR family DNA-binding transcriptional regulator n=1 Tax=Streptomyces sp. NPDC020742 TaxID=3154897 RepID=UPI0033FDB3D2